MNIKLTRLNLDGQLESISATLPDGAELFDGAKCVMMEYQGKRLSLQQSIDEGIIQIKDA